MEEIATRITPIFGFVTKTPIDFMNVLNETKTDVTAISFFNDLPSINESDIPTIELGHGAYGKVTTDAVGTYAYKQIQIGPRYGFSSSYDFLMEAFIQAVLCTDPDPQISSNICKLYNVYKLIKSNGDTCIVLKMDNIGAKSTIYDMIIFGSADNILLPLKDIIKKLITLLDLLQTKYMFRHSDLHIRNLAVKDSHIQLIDFGGAQIIIEGKKYATSAGKIESYNTRYNLRTILGESKDSHLSVRRYSLSPAVRSFAQGIISQIAKTNPELLSYIDSWAYIAPTAIAPPPHVIAPPPHVIAPPLFLLKTLTGHTMSVNSVTSLGADRLASGSTDKTIKIWNITTGALIRTLMGHTSHVTSVTNLGTDRLASASHDTTIRVWDANTEICLRTLTGHTSSVKCVTALGDDRLASGSSDGTIKIWNITTGALIHTLTGHTMSVNSVTSLGADHLASGSTDKTIKIWNITTGALIRTLTWHTMSVNSVTRLGADHFASGSTDKTIKIWNITTGALKTLTGHTMSVNSVTSLGTDRLASASDDRTVRLWDAKTGALIHILTGHTYWVTSVTSLGTDHLASGSSDGTINIWRPPFTSPPPAEEHLARRGRYSTRKHSTRKHSTRKHSARKRSTRKRSL